MNASARAYARPRARYSLMSASLLRRTLFLLLLLLRFGILLFPQEGLRSWKQQENDGMLDKCDLFCWKNWKQQTIGEELLDV
jgi:hypothetical protein